jgi:predicted PurR-regulated permease PerM
MARTENRVQRRRPPRQAWLGGAAVLLVAVMVWMLRDLLVLVGFSLLLAYALDPIVKAVERLRIRGHGISRPFASGLVMLAVVALSMWGISWIVPQLVGQVLHFIERAPAIVSDLVFELGEWARTHGFGEYVQPVTEAVKIHLTTLAQNAAGWVPAWIGRIFGNIGSLIGVLLLPVLSFYLLAEREDVKQSAFGFIPARHHGAIVGIGDAVDRALRSYVRGQAIVCLVMGVTVGAVLAVLQYPYALFLGALVAFAEVIPYLGFAIAIVAIALTGFTVGMIQGLLGVVVYAVVNNLVGLFVTPRLMGRYLTLHPYVVTVSLLAGAQLFGPAGIMLALPGAAVIQALVARPSTPRTSEP